MTEKLIDTGQFGKTGRAVTLVGLGGEGILRTYGRDEEAQEVIEEAIDQGITYFDCARAYSGSEEYYGQVWRRRPADREKIFQTSKSASRNKRSALADLDRTLTNMGTDYLDLWQIHDVRSEEDLEMIAGPNGALEAFVQAKAAGKVRFMGVTGHHDPGILTRAVRDWPVDSVLFPVNPVEGLLGGFLTETLVAAKEKGVAVIGMKVLGGGHYIFPQSGISPETLIRFAISQPITVAIVGCSTPAHVQTLAACGRDFKPMSSDEQTRLLDIFRPHASRLAFYRSYS
ncbi:MAG: aldo/keto reductase [Deltaproteobacteria bacterium]|nr:aldo/keto reductase [Deltaproteobacteria bacterium]